ncbi:hypothetical protein ACQ4PT_056668 [Festuca glaucescens]
MDPRGQAHSFNQGFAGQQYQQQGNSTNFAQNFGGNYIEYQNRGKFSTGAGIQNNQSLPRNNSNVAGTQSRGNVSNNHVGGQSAQSSGQLDIFCVHCGKTTHLSGKCLLPSQPKPVAALIGGGADGLQMFTSLTSKKSDLEQFKQDVAIVTVHSGVVTAQQLVDAFSRQFQWGWDWKAKGYLKDSFLVKFPSVQKIDEMKAFNYFGLLGHRATIRVNRWSNSYMAKYKLYTVWVRMTGIPETMLHHPGFCEAASLIGKVKEIDMELYRRCDIIRAKVGVRDLRKIPSSAPLNDEDFIYDIYFELEDIVEEGGPLSGGVLVSNNETVRDSQTQSTSATGELKRGGEQLDYSQNSKSPKKHDSDSMKEDVNLPEEREKDAVLLSQCELDKNLLEEKEPRKKLLARQQENEITKSAVDNVNEQFATDSEMLENVEDEEEEEDPDDFARKLGLGTQQIRRIEREIDREAVEEMNKDHADGYKENICPEAVGRGTGNDSEKMSEAEK